MNIDNFPTLLNFINRKTGMSSGHLKGCKIIQPNEGKTLIDAVSVLHSVHSAVISNKLPPRSFSPTSILSLAPVTVNDEAVDPTTFYKLVLEKAYHQIPYEYADTIRDLANIVISSVSLPIERARYLFVRNIVKRLKMMYPELSGSFRTMALSDHCQIYTYSHRFVFICYGDTGIARDPSGHIDVFGIDLKGLVENYLNGDDLTKNCFRMPSLLSFKNQPTTERNSGGAVMVQQVMKPFPHTWVDVRGRRAVMHEEVTLDFNSIPQTYVNNQDTVINDVRWTEIKRMIKFDGDQDVKPETKAGRPKATTSRTKLKQAS